jgi:hypothetical protein
MNRAVEIRENGAQRLLQAGDVWLVVSLVPDSPGIFEVTHGTVESIRFGCHPPTGTRPETDAKERFVEFTEIWGAKYPAIIRLWENALTEFAPFLDYSPEIRKVIYSTNAVESLHARMRRATRARGHFPTEQAALKCLYLVVRSLDPTGRGRKRWMNRWKAPLNAFAITFEGRILPEKN